MSKTPEQTNVQNDVAIMRDILMGGHIKDYEARFEQLNATIAQMNADHLKRMEEMENRIMSKISHLEAAVRATTDDLQRQIKDVSKQDKTTLGDLLAELSQKVKGD
jgi:DNA anti-recombination protein RmuC